MGDTNTQEQKMSTYEMERARNIERNNARLRALGLLTQSEEEDSNRIAWKRECAEQKKNDDPKKKRMPPKERSPLPAERSSKRLKGLQPDGSATSEVIGRYENVEEERENRVRECREARQRAAIELQEAGGKNRNPTATYEHCLMRVRSMSHAGLANRVKVIERAAGKHCVVKMAIFKSCLQDEGEWELAGLAGEALERLKALQPPPPTE